MTTNSETRVDYTTPGFVKPTSQSEIFLTRCVVCDFEIPAEEVFCSDFCRNFRLYSNREII